LDGSPNAKVDVLQNTIDKLVNYELRRKMRRDGVPVQQIGVELLWKTPTQSAATKPTYEDAKQQYTVDSQQAAHRSGRKAELALSRDQYVHIPTVGAIAATLSDFQPGAINFASACILPHETLQGSAHGLALVRPWLLFQLGPVPQERRIMVLEKRPHERERE